MQASVRKCLHCSFILRQLHYNSCTDMGWSYTRVTCAVFCSAVLRVSPRYNCAVFCITAVHTLCVFCSVTHVLCVFCSVACRVHLEAWATLVFEPSRNSLLCGLQHSPRLRCCTNVIWTLRWGNAIVCITAICLVFTCNACRMYLSFLLLISTPFSPEPVTTALCFYWPSCAYADMLCADVLMCYV